jgi:hypothetical protein
MAIEKRKKRLNLAVQPFVLPGSILVRHHYGDGRFWQIHVVGTTDGNQLHKTWAAVVVSDVKRILDTVAVPAAAFDGRAEHRNDVPKPSFLTPFCFI